MLIIGWWSSNNRTAAIGENRNDIFSRANGSERSRISAYLTSTKKKRKLNDGKMKNKTKQGYCSILKSKTK